MKNTLRSLLATAVIVASGAASAEGCPVDGHWLQVLGSGGPEIGDQRASSSYLLWADGKARVLIDTGAGSQPNFEKAGANFNDIDAILYSHLHVDHSVDFAAFIKSSFFTGRSRDLPVWGPSGNRLLPAMDQFVERQIGEQGAWPYMSNYLDGNGRNYQVKPQVFSTDISEPRQVFSNERFTVSAIGVNHGALPAVAWRVDFKGGYSATFSGDMSGVRGTLPKLAQNTDMLVAHNAIPESARGVARRLHMPPSVIGEIAGTAKARQLVLSHRMLRTLENGSQTEQLIKQNYSGSVAFAEDLSCFKL